MPAFYTKIAVGVDWDGETLHLVALGRRFRQSSVIGSFCLGNLQTEESRKQLAEFLRQHRLPEARVIACLPREALVVRFLDLPLEAESQLAKVVGYQVDVLHPFEDARWDCVVVRRDTKGKQIQVMVVVVETVRLEEYYATLENLGLRVESLTFAAANLGSLIGPVLPQAAVVISGREGGIELLGFSGPSLCASRYLSTEPSESAGERFERELHGLRAVLPVADPMTQPLFVCGRVPAAFSETLVEAAMLPELKLPVSTTPGFDARAQLSALGAAYVGLRRGQASMINLLPPERQKRSKPWIRVPIYTLGTTAAVLAFALAGNGWIETQLYSRTLDDQIHRLESQAAKVRRADQQIGALATRAAVLEGARGQTWQKLGLVKELSKILPDGTWLQQIQLEEETAELYGYSDRAADLVQILENSSYFSHVEFAAPIIRDAQNREVFRIRMRVGKSVRP